MSNHIYYMVLFCCVVNLYACNNDDGAPIDNVFRFAETIIVDDQKRGYILNLPSNYYKTTDFSLVIAMHGGGGSAEQFESTSKLTEKAEASKFIVVYPEGVQRPRLLKLRTWNADACCGYAAENNINDVTFISRLIDELISKYDINPKKVYATGHSNGGMMAYRLACELSEKIAAIAPNGCTMVTSTCNPIRAVPVLHMHSELDTDIPFEGGSGSGLGTAGIQLASIDSVLNFWSLNNNCANVAEVIVDNSDYKLSKWTNCNENVAIEYYLTQDGGHGWPGGLRGSAIGDNPSTVINANDLLWEFFQQYQLP